MKSLFGYIYRIEKIGKNVTHGYLFNVRIYYKKITKFSTVTRLLCFKKEKINYNGILIDQLELNNKINEKLLRGYSSESKPVIAVDSTMFRDSLIRIVYIFDENYMMPTLVSLNSLLSSRSKQRSNFYDIYLISQDVEKNKLTVFEKFNDFENCKITIIEKNGVEGFEKVSDISTPGFHVTKAALLKFFLGDILNFADKVLYIDSDTVINKDLSELYSTVLSDSYAAVVEDIKPKLKYRPPILVKLGITKHRGYFNSGVLLLNLKKIRHDKIGNALLKYRINGINYFMDQDALNVCLKDKVIFKDFKFNMLMHNFEAFKLDEIYKQYKLKSNVKNTYGLIRNAHIVHYSSKSKPWKERACLNELWYKHFLMLDSDVKNSCEITPKEKVIVSFTTYEKRIEYIEPVLTSLLNQRYIDYKLVLWLSNEKYNEDNLPGFIKKYLSEKFSVSYCDEMYSYKKLLPNFIKNNSYDAIVVTADDDIIYHDTWLLELMASYMSEPNAIHCHRGHTVSFDDSGVLQKYTLWKRSVLSDRSAYTILPTGCGGILYPPNSLNSNVTNLKEALNICPSGDDIWFWCNALLNKTKIKTVGCSNFKLIFADGTQDNSLYMKNDQGGLNDIMLKKVWDKYLKDIDLFN